MSILRRVAEQPFGLMFGFIVASLLFLAAFGLALKTGGVLATHDGNVHACINLYTGDSKIKRPGQPPNCGPYEVLVEWPGNAIVGDLDDRVQALEEQVPDCLATESGDAVFEGCNVHIRNGAGDTYTTNSKGNLIVGYNEESPGGDVRDGSHNLVVGPYHDYTSYGGLVAGVQNQILGPYSSVSGGGSNKASGDSSSVAGGFFNEATGLRSSVSGGSFNVASGFSSSVSGGRSNEASGEHSSVSGGQGNEATGDYSSVSGGLNRTTNSADPDHDWRGGGLLQDN